MLLRSLRVIACCASGLRAALEGFEARFLSQVPSFVARIDSSAAFADEVKQELRTRLLVGSDGRSPRIADYTGAGPLARWLQVAALRTALNLRRQNGGPRVEALGSEGGLADGDPELSYRRASSRRVFEEALRAALGSLSARERNLLRFHFIDGLSTPQIAELLRTHRTTVRRQLNDCHARLLSTLRADLRQRLGLTPSEVESYMRTAKSQIELSLSELERGED